MRYEFNGHTEGGVLKIVHRRMFDECVRNFKGRPVTVTLELKKKHRTNPQNAYFHGPLLDQVQLLLIDAGYNEARSKTWVKDLLKYQFLKQESASERTGEILVSVRSTADLTTSEFMDLIAEIQQWAAEMFNARILGPNEVEGRFKV